MGSKVTHSAQLPLDAANANKPFVLNKTEEGFHTQGGLAM
jgi:hypothetical protein